MKGTAAQRDDCVRQRTEGVEVQVPGGWAPNAHGADVLLIVPGTTENFASNKIIIAGLTAEAVWQQLDDTRALPTYYRNAADIRFHDGSGPYLSNGARFRFTTFGFPVEAQVTEHMPPVPGQPARVAWHGWGLTCRPALPCPAGCAAPCAWRWLAALWSG